MRERNKRVLAVLCAVAMVFSSNGIMTVRAQENAQTDAVIEVSTEEVKEDVKEDIEEVDAEVVNEVSQEQISVLSEKENHITDAWYGNGFVYVETNCDFDEDDCEIFLNVKGPEGQIEGYFLRTDSVYDNVYGVRVNSAFVESGEYLIDIYHCKRGNDYTDDVFVKQVKADYTRPSKKLDTPQNVILRGSTLIWDTVENAALYQLLAYEKVDSEYVFRYSYEVDYDGEFKYFYCKQVDNIDPENLYARVVAIPEDVKEYARSDYSEYAKNDTEYHELNIDFFLNYDIDALDDNGINELVEEIISECANKNGREELTAKLSKSADLRAKYEKLENRFMAINHRNPKLITEQDLAGKVKITGSSMSNYSGIQEIEFKLIDDFTQECDREQLECPSALIYHLKLNYSDFWTVSDVPTVITMSVPGGFDVNKLIILAGRESFGRQYIDFINNNDGTITFVVQAAEYLVFTNGEVAREIDYSKVKHISNLQYDGKGHVTFDLDYDFAYSNEYTVYIIKAYYDERENYNKFINNYFEEVLAFDNFEDYKTSDGHYSINISSCLNRTGKFYLRTIAEVADFYGYESFEGGITEKQFKYTKPANTLSCPANITFNTNGNISWSPVEHASEYKIEVWKKYENNYDRYFSVMSDSQGKLTVDRAYDIVGNLEDYAIRIESISEDVNVYGNSEFSELVYPTKAEQAPSNPSPAPSSGGGSVAAAAVSVAPQAAGNLVVTELGNAVDALGVEQLVVSVKMNGNAMIPASVFEKYLGKNVLINVDVNDGTILQFSCATLTADMIKNGVYIKKQDRNFTIVLNSVDMSKNLVIYAKCDGLEVNKQTTLNFVDDNGVLTPFRKSVVFENGLTAFTVPFVGARFEVTQ